MNGDFQGTARQVEECQFLWNAIAGASKSVLPLPVAAKLLVFTSLEGCFQGYCGVGERDMGTRQ